jgi:hypothetical protein
MGKFAAFLFVSWEYVDWISYLDIFLNLKLFINNNKLQDMNDSGKYNVIQFEKQFPLYIILLK